MLIRIPTRFQFETKAPAKPVATPTKRPLLRDVKQERRAS
jgi:hypothetical protein